MDEIENPPVKSAVTVDDIEKLDIRIGTITTVADVADSNKLIKLSVDFGDHSRQVLVGMKQEQEDPTEIEGRQALFVINLEPRTMAGEVSEGMVLDIGYEDGITPVLAVPERPVPDGTRVG